MRGSERFILERGASYHFAGRLYHIRGEVDADEDRIIVVRTWNRKRRLWQYECEYADVILALVNDGTFRPARKQAP